MCKKTKYKNYRIGKYLFTVEIKKGCDCFGDYFYITIRDRHDAPRNFFERIKLKFKNEYVIGDSYWRPLFDKKNFERFILDKLDFIVDNKFNLEEANILWENLEWDFPFDFLLDLQSLSP